MKNFSLLFVVGLLAISVPHTSAQMRPDGKWHFPENIKNLCLNHEQNLVALFKGMIERNRDFLDPNSKNEKSNYSQLNEATQRAIVEHEISWQRLGCAMILYGARP
jgi:hypothetical protein